MLDLEVIGIVLLLVAVILDLAHANPLREIANMWRRRHYAGIASFLLRGTDVTRASEASLRRALLTCDGQGEKFKEECLRELMQRAKLHGVNAKGRLR